MEAKTLVVTRTSLRFIFCCRRMRCRTPDEILERTRTCGFGAPRRGAALPSLATGCCGRGSATRVGRRAAGVQAAEGRVGAATRTMRRTISASTSSSRYLGVCSFMLMSLWECPRRWSTRSRGPAATAHSVRGTMMPKRLRLCKDHWSSSCFVNSSLRVRFLSSAPRRPHNGARNGARRKRCSHRFSVSAQASPTR